MRTRRFSLAIACVLLAGGVTGLAVAQSKTDRNLKTFGSRVGDREADPASGKLIGNRRINARINSRIDSRLETRQDRFVLPDPAGQPAYAPEADDGTKGDKSR